MALFPQLAEIQRKLQSKTYLSEKEKALLSELNAISSRTEYRSIVEGSVNLTKMTGPDDGRCGCCGR